MDEVEFIPNFVFAQMSTIPHVSFFAPVQLYTISFCNIPRACSPFLSDFELGEYAKPGFFLSRVRETMRDVCVLKRKREEERRGRKTKVM